MYGARPREEEQQQQQQTLGILVNSSGLNACFCYHFLLGREKERTRKIGEKEREKNERVCAARGAEHHREPGKCAAAGGTLLLRRLLLALTNCFFLSFFGERS